MGEDLRPLAGNHFRALQHLGRAGEKMGEASAPLLEGPAAADPCRRAPGGRR
jgi:hypothetical protein